ncbi:hypothetical protein Glo7428_3765 [Gloeocapsa sp. PCC 7428]|uniref:hypothetical protein n=1 Tax=Gloeocapsa sp. PCC 7428 TaxID=1173026 RepID=UPI0002A5D29E|nr:hypothetical protein [Gloeocapsa sp. PCC 7428]AFZ32225.1 hypothetical protein Glo7428_3765 [Gloeocapsa sp. PCC 7428]
MTATTVCVSARVCQHERLIIGLDCAYCPDCKREFLPWTPEYQNLLSTPEPTDISSGVTQDSSGVNSKSTPEHIHWVETYSPSNKKKHVYYRYVWMEKQKLHHVHIPGGNTANERAIALQEQVTEAIKRGDTPVAIKALIKNGLIRP